MFLLFLACVVGFLYTFSPQPFIYLNERGVYIFRSLYSFALYTYTERFTSNCVIAKLVKFLLNALVYTKKCIPLFNGELDFI